MAPRRRALNFAGRDKQLRQVLAAHLQQNSQRIRRVRDEQKKIRISQNGTLSLSQQPQAVF